MFPLTYNTLVVMLGTACIGATCGLVGTFAVVRKRALVGDAVAHATLPGVCLGYLLAGGQSLPLQFAGAFLTGLLAVGIIRILPETSRIKTETAVAGVLSVFFGAGIALTRVIQNSGNFGGRAGFDAFLFGSPGSLLMDDLILIAGVCLLVIGVIYSTFRLSVGVAFDSEFLSIQGLPTSKVDWLHLILLTTTIVVSLPAIGAVMIVALLITPAVTARILSDRFGVILLCSATLGMIASVIGTMMSSISSKIPAGATAVLACTVMYIFTLAIREFLKPIPSSEEVSQRN